LNLNGFKNKKSRKNKKINSDPKQPMSIAKATRMNSCLKRRNPYKIYTKNKKD
jgi:hypothetical protein